MEHLTGVILIEGVLHQEALANIHFAMETKIKQRTDGHKADTTQLNEHDEHHLPKKAQLLARIPHSKTGHAGGRGGCKKCVQGMGPLPADVGNRQAQKHSSQKN